MIKFIFITLLSFSLANAASVGGNKTRFNAEQVEKDINSQNMSKYQNDNFEKISPKSLVQKHIISDENLTTNNAEITSATDFVVHIDDCSKIIDTTKWTASLYGVDLENGKLSCLVAPVDDLENPLGVFDILYPNAKTFFQKDLAQAKIDKAVEIDDAKFQFSGIYGTIKEKQDALKEELANNANYLTIPETLTSVLLTDTNVIDIEETRQTGTLQFKAGVNTSPELRNTINQVASSLFSAYAGLSDYSMIYLLYIIVFLGGFGIAKVVFSSFTNKTENIKENKSKIAYLFGILAAFMLFFPFTENPQTAETTSADGRAIANYNIMNTKYQDFERKGYSLFSKWANDAASVVIDAEMQSIIEKSGIGTAEQIAATYAAMVSYQKKKLFTENIDSICRTNYDLESMKLDGKALYADTQNTLFPTSENYGYAMALHNGNANDYYLTLPSVDFYSQETINGYNSTYLNNGDSQEVESIGAYYYPKISLAACGKNYYDMRRYEQKHYDFGIQSNSLEGSHNNDSAKIAAIEQIVDYQYQLFNDWGYLAVLGLPITKMQTELIGGLYTQNLDNTLAKVDTRIEKNPLDMTLHKLFAAMPYMLVPGSEKVYDITKNSSAKLGKSLSDIPFVGSFFEVAGEMYGRIIALGMVYNYSIVMLFLVPIIAVIILGLLRFSLIITKIFSLHFAALFLLPVAFAEQNLENIKSFTVKLFATMLELPLFVVSIFIAIEINTIIATFATHFAKNATIEMLANNYAMHQINGSSASAFIGKILIYSLDGMMQLAVAILSIIIMYLIIIKFHSMVMESINLKGVQLLDNSIDKLRNDGGKLGAKS